MGCEDVDMQHQRQSERVLFVLEEEDLAKYNLSLEHMRQRKPFTEKLVVDIVDVAHKTYGMDFDIDCCGLDIMVYEKDLVMSIREKSNIIQLENDFIEEENIIYSLHQLFRELPDEQINVGIMDVNKKRKLLEEMRSEAGREIVRRDFIDYE